MFPRKWPFLAACAFLLVGAALVQKSDAQDDKKDFPEHRFEAESAVVVRAVRRGFRILTVPVELGFADGRLTSHYRPLVDSLRIAAAVTHARFEDNPPSSESP